LREQIDYCSEVAAVAYLLPLTTSKFICRSRSEGSDPMGVCTPPPAHAHTPLASRKPPRVAQVEG
jgi:hypothetical protein